MSRAGGAPGLGTIARRTVRAWLAGDAMHWGAALSYYALVSLGPLLLLAVGTAGLVLGANSAGSTIVAQLDPILGPRGATVAETILREGSFPGFGSPQAIGSVALLLIAGTAVFVNLRRALNAIWSVSPDTGPLWSVLRARLAAFLMIAVVGGLMIASFALTTAATALAPYLESWLPGRSQLVHALDFGVSTVLLWLAFAAMFRILPDTRPAWRDVWIGAFATALLFVAGKALIGFYLGRSDLGSVHGAAGSIFLLLVWLYYSAQIVLLGATFTEQWACARGRRIRPDDASDPGRS